MTPEEAEGRYFIAFAKLTVLHTLLTLTAKHFAIEAEIYRGMRAEELIQRLMAIMNEIIATHESGDHTTALNMTEAILANSDEEWKLAYLYLPVTLPELCVVDGEYDPFAHERDFPPNDR